MKASDILDALGGLLKSGTAPVGELVPLEAPSKRGDQYVAVRSDYRIDRLPAPRKAKRKHTFHDLRSFAEWLLRFGKTPDEVEILVGEQLAHAALGMDPDASRVECQLRKHPTFEAWNAILGKAMDAKGFHAFVRSVADTFALDASDGPHYGDQLLAELAKLKVVTGEDIDLNIDPRGFFTLHGAKERVQIDAKIPPTFDVRVPVLIAIPGDPPEADEPEAVRAPEKLYTLGIVLTLDVRKDVGAVFSLTCPGLKRVLHDARMDAVEYLRELLGANAPGSFLVGLGDESTEIIEG